jgi:hypothetical protein
MENRIMVEEQKVSYELVQDELIRRFVLVGSLKRRFSPLARHIADVSSAHQRWMKENRFVIKALVSACILSDAWTDEDGGLKPREEPCWMLVGTFRTDDNIDQQRSFELVVSLAEALATSLDQEEIYIMFNNTTYRIREKHEPAPPPAATH